MLANTTKLVGFAYLLPALLFELNTKMGSTIGSES